MHKTLLMVALMLPMFSCSPVQAEDQLPIAYSRWVNDHVQIVLTPRQCGEVPDGSYVAAIMDYNTGKDAVGCWRYVGNMVTMEMEISPSVFIDLTYYKGSFKPVYAM